MVLNINLNVDAETNATFLLDFDLNKSIVSGALGFGGSFKLSPVIKVRRAKQTGSISGTVKPAKARPWVHAIHNSDTTSSTLADTSSGEFKLSGLKEQSYDVHIQSTDSTYLDTTIADVQVEARENNSLGEIELSKRDSTAHQDPVSR